MIGPFPIPVGPRLSAVVVGGDPAVSDWIRALRGIGWAVAGAVGAQAPPSPGAPASAVRHFPDLASALAAVPVHAVVLATSTTASPAGAGTTGGFADAGSGAAAKSPAAPPAAVAEALRRGKHVLLPLEAVPDAATAWQWEGAAKRAGAVVLVDDDLWWDPVLVTVAEVIVSGAVGPVEAVEVGPVEEVGWSGGERMQPLPAVALFAWLWHLCGPDAMPTVQIVSAPGITVAGRLGVVVGRPGRLGRGPSVRVRLQPPAVPVTVPPAPTVPYEQRRRQLAGAMARAVVGGSSPLSETAGLRIGEVSAAFSHMARVWRR